MSFVVRRMKENISEHLQWSTSLTMIVSVRDVYYLTTPIHIFIGLEINFEESDYAIEEGRGLNTLICLQFRNNQNAFNITFSPVTIAFVEDMGLGANFINSDTIEEEARAEPGEVLVKICDC